MFNPISYIKNWYSSYLFKMKMAKRNDPKDIEFLLHILEFPYLEYNSFVFMPGEREYLNKIKSIGFEIIINDMKNPRDFLLDFHYNNKLNIGIHIVPIDRWDAMILTINAMKQLYSPALNSEYEAIGVIYCALREYKPHGNQ